MNEKSLTKTSNWGRWGAADERGAANFATPDKIRKAAKLIQTGRVHSLSLPIQARGTPIHPRRAAPLHFMTLDGGDYAAGLTRKGGHMSSDDYIALSTHGTTHIDALAHFWYEDQLYNGFPGNSVRSSGAKHCGIEKLSNLVGRGVLLDLCRYLDVEMMEPGQVISPAMMIDCATAQGVSLEAGDIVLLRTGWQKVFREKGGEAFFAAEPGIGEAACEWIGEKGIAAVGSDNFGVEVIPTERGVTAPVHQRLIRDFGVYLMELLALDALAEDEVHEFMFVAAPLLITGGVGSPLNPLAIS